MFRGYIFLVLGLLLYSREVLSDPPKVVSSSYTVETGSVLESDISLAVFTVDFDQDLYVPDITSPCREQSEPCDPKAFGECGKGCDYTHAGCLILQVEPDPCCPDYNTYCDLDHVAPWIDLVNSTAMNKQLMNAETIYYRFYNPDPCGPVTMHVNMRSGLVLSYGSRMEPASPDTNEWAIPTPWRPLYHFYCPHNETSLAGTYYFTYRGKGYNANFNVTVTSYFHEPDTTDYPLCTVPKNYTYASNDTLATIGTPQELSACLQPNAAFHGMCEEINANYLFLYEINSCQRLHVQLSMNTIGMDADSDLLSWDYVSYLEGDDYLQMSLCGTKAAPIYLTMVINCWSVAEPSNYTLIVAKQSDATFRTVPITETSPYLIVVETAGMVRFLLPNSNTITNYSTDDWLNTFHCTDYSFTCYQLWPVYPSADVNFFWPTPAFLITQLRNTELDSLQLNIPQANPRQLKFAVLLKLEVDGNMQYFLDESDLPSASFLFYGKIVNADGLPVFGQYNATATAPTCNYTSFLALKSQTEALIGDARDPSLLQMLQYQLDAVRFKDVWVGCANLLTTLYDQTLTVYNQTSTSCNHPYQSEEWFNDGCCFTGVGWNGGCIPREQSVSIPTFAINNRVASQCAHHTCARGLLEFYQVTLEDYYSADTACTSSLKLSSTDYLISAIELYLLKLF